MATHRPPRLSACQAGRGRDRRRALLGLALAGTLAAGLLAALPPDSGQAAAPHPTAPSSSSDTLGALYTSAHTTVRIWSPDTSRSA